MRDRWGLSVVFTLSFLCTGCPLSSQYSLGDKHDAPVYQKMIGKWVGAEPGKDDEGAITIFRFNENEYYIEISDNRNKKIDRFRAFITKIDNVSILNVQDVSETEPNRHFIYVKVSEYADNTIMFSVVEDDLLPRKEFSSRADLLKFIRSNITNSRLYDNLVTLKRAGQ